MKINEKGISLIKTHEGLELMPYEDAAGYATIGYGHKIKNGEIFGSITASQAEDILRQDLRSAEAAVTALAKGPITSNQFSAMVSLVFNIGAGNFESSTLLKKVNSQEFVYVPEEFARWNKAKNAKSGKWFVLPGLIKRRADEALLFINKN